jgi:hypothetical protein
MEEKAIENLTETPEKTQPEQAQAEAKAPEENEQQINWRKFREARDAERKAAEEDRRKYLEKEKEANAMKAAMEAILDKKDPPRSVNQQEGIEETEEQRILRLVDERLAAEKRKNQEEAHQRELQEAFPRAVKTFSDFTQVYTTENCDYLEYHHPELFNSLKQEPDTFEKWTRVYNAIKRYIPNAASKKDQTKADKNMSKPQSMAVPGTTQVGDTAPMMLTEDRKKDNWKRMQQRMKGIA